MRKFGITGMFPIGTTFVRGSVAFTNGQYLLVRENGWNSTMLELPKDGIRTVRDVSKVAETMVDTIEYGNVPVTLPADRGFPTYTLAAFIEKMNASKVSNETILKGLLASYEG